LIAESSTEFGAENYAGALYLATQGRTLVRGGQARLSASGGESLRTGESLFAIPVPLQTASRANVRRGPSLESSVEFTLGAAALVVGQSYTSQWVHVVDEEGREGWIFHTLVTARGR
jgi:SH3-like domain-containing protein